MDKLKRFFGVATLLFSTLSSGAIIVSFDTTVTQISGETTTSLLLGQTFNYELLIDTDADAFRLTDAGTSIDMPDYAREVGGHTYLYDQFFADLFSINDNLIDDENNGVMEWNRGVFRNNTSGTNHLTALDVGDMLEMSIFSIENIFEVGTVWKSHRKFHDEFHGSMFYNGTGSVKAVRVVDVPEPPLSNLMGIGILGVVLFSRRILN